MLFSSPTFFVFFFIYFILHLITPKQYRIYLMILGGTVFYLWWRVEYIFLPFLMAAIAYFGILWIMKMDDPAVRKKRAVVTVIVLFIPLIFFKYTDFILRDIVGLLFGVDGIRNKAPDLSLPLGISFMTFTLTAFVIDIYKGKFPVTRSPSTVLAYTLFFPNLSAGPILRPIELIPQILHRRITTLHRFKVPLAIFSIGLVKKLVFADQIAASVNEVYGQNGMPTALDAILAIYGFSVQIYCDFSGYTDMAIGLALALGIKLPNNFARPYGANSLVDFWRRWHITLSFFLRDYLYKSLGGNRFGRIKEIRNVMITTTLCGLWHGASWNFVIWGMIHGVGVSIAHLAKSAFSRLSLGRVPDWIAVLLTFHFVTFAWVFFRAQTLGKAIEILSAPFVGTWIGCGSFIGNNLFTLMLIILFFTLHPFDDHRRVKAAVRLMRPEYVWSLIVLGWVLAITVSQGNSAVFIYFDF